MTGAVKQSLLFSSKLKAHKQARNSDIKKNINHKIIVYPSRVFLNLI